MLSIRHQKQGYAPQKNTQICSKVKTIRMQIPNPNQLFLHTTYYQFSERNIMYFGATEHLTNCNFALWRTDGTEEETYILKTFASGDTLVKILSFTK